MPGGLLLPAPTSLEQRHRCLMCGFEADAVHVHAFLRHVRKCAGEHEGEFAEAVAEKARTIFTGHSPDPERDAHFAAGGN